MSNDLTADQWTTLVDKVNAAAKRVARQWPDVVTAEDLAQDMTVYLLESPGTLSRIFEEDEQTVGSFLIKVAHRLASVEQQEYDRFSGNYLYDSPEVRVMLDNGGITDVTGDRFSAEQQDLKEGLANLAETSSAYYAEIVNRYVHDIRPESGSAGMKRLTRAVDALTERMNRIGADRRRRFVEGPGSRKAVPNALAVALNE